MSEIKLSPQQALILRLLLENPTKAKYGLELVREEPDRLSSGGIYVQLQRLKKKGLVSSRKVPQPSGPPRHLFSVTGAGSSAFRAYILAEEAKLRRLGGGILVPQ